MPELCRVCPIIWYDLQISSKRGTKKISAHLPENFWTLSRSRHPRDNLQVTSRKPSETLETTAWHLRYSVFENQSFYKWLVGWSQLHNLTTLWPNFQVEDLQELKLTWVPSWARERQKWYCPFRREGLGENNPYFQVWKDDKIIRWEGGMKSLSYITTLIFF